MSKSSTGQEKVRLVNPVSVLLWTIMSIFTPELAKGPKIFAATPGLSSILVRVSWDSFFWKAIPETIFFSIISSSSHTSVPSSLEKLFKTVIGTLCRIASSTALVCSTLAPREAISSISSKEIFFNFDAFLLILGSVVKIPDTSVYISHRFACMAAAIATADVSEPPLPSVVSLPLFSIPWNPETTATLVPCLNASTSFSVLISSIFAFEWKLSVITGSCQPRQLLEGIPILFNARDKREDDISSPVDIKESYSGSTKLSIPTCFAKLMSLLVWLDIAETTATTFHPFFTSSEIISLTVFILSTSPTEVPPNFIVKIFIVYF